MGTIYLCLCMILIIYGAWAPLASSGTVYGTSLSTKHEQWMALHGRVYKDDAEKEMRFKIFVDNTKLIESFNAKGNRTYKLGINRFADLSIDEFKASYNGLKPSYKTRGGIVSSSSSFMYKNVSSVPSSMDWRKKGAVTPIKDQGNCGSCWAFSAVGAMEGITKLKTGKLVSLSEQELVDCDTIGENAGCDGGLMDNAFKFIMRNGGLTSESNYPYKGVDGTCDTNKIAKSVAKINGYQDVPANNEKALLKAVANQPVSVAIDSSSFQFYSNGVFSNDCGTSLNHAVTAVGYGTTDDGTKYWILKNSWGSSWGEDGYMKVQRSVTAKEGMCGIAMMASYPTA